MNKDETKEAIKVMQAYVDGLEVEWSSKIDDVVVWRDILENDPYWNFIGVKYRIKDAACQ